MEYVFRNVVLLGVLIFFHELGYFIVAKLCGVRVEFFSLGFGTKLIKREVGQTDYYLSLIPLGGYVQLRGEDLNVFRQMAIAAAGPLFNIGFAIFLAFFSNLPFILCFFLGVGGVLIVQLGDLYRSGIKL